jgi:hypothetical protein
MGEFSCINGTLDASSPEPSWNDGGTTESGEGGGPTRMTGSGSLGGCGWKIGVAGPDPPGPPNGMGTEGTPLGSPLGPLSPISNLEFLEVYHLLVATWFHQDQ